MKKDSRSGSQNNYKQMISDWIKTHPTHVKVIIVAILVILFCIIFATCKNGGEEAPQPQQPQPGQKPPAAATAPAATTPAAPSTVAPSTPEVSDIPEGPEDSGTDTVVEETSPASHMIALPGNKNMKLLKVQKGSFRMGSPLRESGRNSSEKLQTVAITDDFYMGTYEVTQEQYQAIMNQNPSRFKGGSLPVENVTWNQAQMFCDRLNSGNYAPAGWKFALPTSAQWEYACRAGTQTPFFWGNALNGDKANCYGSQPYGTRQKGKYVKRTTPVGSYGANAWGLYDMHGNVWEWCKTPAGKKYVLRGGSWANGGILCRSAARFSAAPGKTNQTIGFRVVLVKK